MKQLRTFTIVVTLLFATGTFAQSGSGQGVRQSDGRCAGQGIPTVERHLKVLTEKLNLTGDEQAKVKPILQELHDATQKFMQDESISRDERLDNVRACRYKADRKVREVLNDDQKKKLDQLEEEPHPELHGD
jgi:Spy/CpxP family protein refolding chaperone